MLRGLALFGVLAMNLVTVFRVSIFAQFLPNTEPAGPLDRAVDAMLKVAVDFKALALFSLLFGEASPSSSSDLPGMHGARSCSCADWPCCWRSAWCISI